MNSSQTAEKLSAKDVTAPILKAAKTAEDASRPYVGEDGLKHCGVCGEPIEQPSSGATEIFGATFPRMCLCRRRAAEAREAQARTERAERRRMRCFRRFPNGEKGSFARDSGGCAELAELAQRYVQGFPEMAAQGLGLLICGGVSTGKTFFAEAICNALCDAGYTPFFTTISSIWREQISSQNQNKSAVLQELVRNDLVVLDDFGTEALTPAMKSFLFDVVDALYKEQTAFIITTNLPLKRFTSPPDEEMQRICNRILERCPCPLQLSGNAQNMRYRLVRENHERMMHMLGK